MATPEQIGRILRFGVTGLGLTLSPEQHALLERYLMLVAQWSGRLRLTGARSLEEMARVLVLDALASLPFLPGHGAMIDLGSGAGVPGVPIAVARPDLHVVLAEASRKKAGFLQLVLRELALGNAEVVNARVETLGHSPSHRERYDVVTARALADLRVLLEYALPLLRVGGIAVFPKGRDAAAEVASAARALGLLGGQAELRATPSSPSPVIVVSKIAPTQLAYPRRPGVPSRRPL